MSETKMSDWMERLVKKYSVPTNDTTDKRGMLKDFKITDCECPAREFRSYTPCKHMKRLNEKLTHLAI